MNLNLVLVYGNLTRDPELRAMPSGMNVCSFSIATNRTYKDRDGKRVDQTEFHNVVVFGRQAESVVKFLKKGSSAMVEGRLQTRSWEKDGEKKFRTEIVAERVQFGPRKDGAAGQSAPTQKEEGGQEAPPPTDDINPDDIPF